MITPPLPNTFGGEAFICSLTVRYALSNCQSVPTLSILNWQKHAYVLAHWSAHQSVHDELTELVAIVAVDGVCQTDNHFKIVHVYVPIRAIREQTERAVSVLLSCDTFIT